MNNPLIGVEVDGVTTFGDTTELYDENGIMKNTIYVTCGGSVPQPYYGVLRSDNPYSNTIHNTITSSGPPINYQLRSEIKEIFGNYKKKQEEEFNRIMKIVETTDIASKMKASVSRGYAGFILFESAYLQSFNNSKRAKILCALNRKFNKNDFDGTIGFSQNKDALQCYLNLKEMEIDDGEDEIICEPYRSYEDMEKNVSFNWRNITKYSIYEQDDNLLTICVKQILNVP